MQKTTKLIFSFALLALCWSECVSASPYNKAMGAFPANDSAANKKKTHGKKKPEQQLIIQPIVRLGAGILSYVGNVKANTATTYFQSPASGRPGFDLGLTQRLSPVVEFSLEFLYGNVAETQYTPPAYWNFQSTLTGGGINFLFKILPKQQVTPYVIIGVESFQFLSRADVYDQYGNQYYSWTDGTLRSTPQSASNAAYAKVLNLNYNYSTDVRTLNVGGEGNYTQQTFAVPVGVGFMFRVGTRSDFMIGTTLHYTFTDHIDGLTPQVQGPLKGSLNNDMFLFTYVSLRFNLTRDHPKVHHDYSKAAYVDIKDTVHPYVPGKFDTSLAALQMQHEREYDTSGKYAKQTVDPFEWKTSKPGYVTNYTNVTPSKPAPGLQPTTPANPTPPANHAPETPTNNANANNGGTVYRIQLLATQVPLAEGITFAGINGKADVEVVNGMYRYTTGNFTNSADAQKYLTELKGKGYKDAFIRTDNGKGGAPVPEAPKNVTPKPAAPPANNPPAKQGASNAANDIGAGLVYKVQVGVYGATPPDDKFKSALNQFSDLKIVKDNAGLNHYMVGSYSDFKSATAARDQAKAGGMKDACVMAFNNGHYISNAQAQGMEKK